MEMQRRRKLAMDTQPEPVTDGLRTLTEEHERGQTQVEIDDCQHGASSSYGIDASDKQSSIHSSNDDRERPHGVDDVKDATAAAAQEPHTSPSDAADSLEMAPAQALLEMARARRVPDQLRPHASCLLAAHGACHDLQE